MPTNILGRLLAHRNVILPQDFDWSAKPRDLVDSLMQTLEGQPEQAELFFADAERIDQLSDEAGETVLANISGTNSTSVDATLSRHGRVANVFLDDPIAFKRAELARLTDNKRRTRMWDGFLAPANLQLSLDDNALSALKEALKDHFHSRNVEIDIFKRRRTRADGTDVHLLQLNVFREGLPIEQLRFDDEGELAATPDWPVFEAAFTYEPKTGALEVVTRDVDTREAFAHICAQKVLGFTPSERLTLRRFELGMLRRPFEFDTDAEDGIEFVQVTLLRLMPIDTESERVVLQCMKGHKGTIWSMADDRFGDHSPLSPSWIVTQAKMTVHFHSDEGSGQGPRLSFTITDPHGCDLRDTTERERLIGEKYLYRWGILRNG
jgi:hypothetical protein